METDPTRTCQLLVGLADVVVLGVDACAGDAPLVVQVECPPHWPSNPKHPLRILRRLYPAARKASSKSALNSTNVARSRLVPGNASRTVVTAIRAACPTGSRRSRS